MKPVHEEISDLLSDEKEDRFSCPQEIRKKAMDFLARREYGLEELTKKLADKGYRRAVVEDELACLVEEGLQSDTRFAEAFVQSRVNQGKGPVRIRQELKERGVGVAAVDQAIEEAGPDWRQLAIEVRERKFGAALPANFTEKARQMRFLQYRGFESDHIQAAVSMHGDD